MVKYQKIQNVSLLLVSDEKKIFLVFTGGFSFCTDFLKVNCVLYFVFSLWRPKDVFLSVKFYNDTWLSERCLEGSCHDLMRLLSQHSPRKIDGNHKKIAHITSQRFEIDISEIQILNFQ